MSSQPVPNLQTPTSTSTSSQDPFEELHRLEETFFQEGYALGSTDGTQLGRVEGRVFGSKRAFDRFFEIARLHGQSVVLGNRLPASSGSGLGSGSGSGTEKLRSSTVSDNDSSTKSDGISTPTILPESSISTSTSSHALSEPKPNSQTTNSPELPQKESAEQNDSSLDLDLSQCRLKPLSTPSISRLEKHIRTLYALSEPASLSVVNTEDDVSAFDDRMKRAQGKAVILGRMLGSSGGGGRGGGEGLNGGGGGAGAGGSEEIRM